MSERLTAADAQRFVAWFRAASPYVHTHRGRTFVVHLDGAAVEDPAFPALVHDLALVHALGVRLVLVHGARPQIDRCLAGRGVEPRYAQGLRVTDAAALPCVEAAAGAVRVRIEALLSMGLPNTPMAGARLRVVSGNFVTARPVGVRDGVDFGHTGEVRRIDVAGIRRQLDDGAIVLLGPIGHSPTGEVFNLSAEEVATQAALRLRADKLIFLVEGAGLARGRRGPRELTTAEAERRLARGRLPEVLARVLADAVAACRGGVPRAHIVGRARDGALLLELYTRDGAGTLVSAEGFEELREARIEDLPGIRALIAPLERQGVLVPRPPERLEAEVGRFAVLERDGMIVGTAAVYPFPEERVAELACLAVHPDYRGEGRGDALLRDAERRARAEGAERLFVLTTRAVHWFRERGFEPAEVRDLPVRRRALYNWQRRSKVLVKTLA